MGIFSGDRMMSQSEIDKLFELIRSGKINPADLDKVDLDEILKGDSGS